MQENVSVWPPSEEDLELMSQRGFVCMRDCQSEFLRITVKHVGNFLVKTKAIIYFYRGRSSIKALNTLTIYIEGEELTEIVSRTRRRSLPYRDPAVVRQVSRAANVSTVRRILRVIIAALPWGARRSSASSFSVRILRGRSKPHFSGRVWG